jgi:phosphoglycolate phosphatase-like HAD superfamily hydrolase
MKNTVAKYFDFCVSGEDADIFPNRKPHAGIYQVALERYRQLYAHHRLMVGEDIL